LNDIVKNPDVDCDVIEFMFVFNKVGQKWCVKKQYLLLHCTNGTNGCALKG